MAAEKKIDQVEYRLLIVKTFDDTLNKEGILFHLETTKQFTNFAYRIDIRDTEKEHSLVWTLHGLRAPSMNMPSIGSAQFDKVYFDLPRKISFTLIKKGTLKASTEIKFLKHAFEAAPAHAGFLKVYVDKEEFEKNRSSDALPPELKPDIHRKHSTPLTEKKV
jgi:hypothetical protein